MVSMTQTQLQQSIFRRYYYYATGRKTTNSDESLAASSSSSSFSFLHPHLCFTFRRSLYGSVRQASHVLSAF
ncbi:hypothetical protein TYRP_017564 [Tyrophagus putrescentiae]|nr:hypothetical protein TYRP_017564 [Tyrophagus putrescentiae]